MKQYQHGNIHKFIAGIRQILQSDINASDDFIYAQLAQWYPELKGKDRCPNCDASMQMYEARLDAPNALLLIAMSKIVGERLEQGTPFTEANAVHIQSMPATYATKSRTTQSRYLGLIAKVRNDKGKHVQGTWCITKRGWAALRGEQVPAEVVFFRNQIVSRSDETSTLRHALDTHKQYVRDKKLQGKTPKSDHTADIEEYEKIDWVHYAGLAQGKML